MTKRRFVSIAAFAAPLVGVAVACSFPDVTFGPGASGEGGPSENEAGEAGIGTDGSVSDAPTVDVIRREDGEGPILDASVCEARAKCDCDDDEYADINCDVDAATLTSSKGNQLKPGDCDDLDDYVFPGQTFVVPEQPGNKDYDCSRQVEFFPPQNITCGGSGLLGCTGDPGFVTTPTCGTQADYYSCRANGLGPCVATPAGYKTTQACK